MEEIEHTQSEEYKELKEILLELIINAYNTAIYSTKLEFDSLIKKIEFFHWDINTVLCEIRMNKVNEIETDEHCLNNALQMYYFNITSMMTDEQDNDANYFDFLATYITPFYFEKNENDFQSEIYKNWPKEEKYKFYENLLFDDFVNIFERFKIIKTLNYLTNTDNNTTIDIPHPPSDSVKNGKGNNEIDEAREFDISKCESEIINNFNFWKNITSQKNAKTLHYKDILKDKEGKDILISDYLQMFQKADFSKIFNKGATKRVCYDICEFNVLLGNRWGEAAAKKVGKTLAYCQGCTIEEKSRK